MQMPRIPVWLDCDPGHDDAMAIILAGHSPSIQLLGISTVACNQTIEKVTQNCLDVVSAAGMFHVDVVAGQAKPLLRPSPLLCPEIHGETGLDGPQGGRLLPRSSCIPKQGKAVVVIFEAIQQHYEKMNGSQKIRLVCTGALSNAALLLMLYPEVLPMIEIVIMGGCMGIGNTGPVVEFNIQVLSHGLQVDPEAAKVVFESGVHLTMVPLEVTHTVLATPEVLTAIGGAEHSVHSASCSSPDLATAATATAPSTACITAVTAGPDSSNAVIAASADLCTADAVQSAAGLMKATGQAMEAGLGAVPTATASGSGASPQAAVQAAEQGLRAAASATTPFRSTVVQLLLFFAATYRSVFGFEHPPLHDPCAVAYVIAPELFKVAHMRVDIEVCSQLSAGQTVCDRWRTSGRPSNCHVALSVDVARFWSLMVDAVARADAVSPLNHSQQ